MFALSDAVAVAEELIRQYGDNTYAILARRVINCHRASDREGASLWQQVAEAVRHLQARRSHV